MPTQRTDIRLALPSKGRMEEETTAFLSAAGLRISKANLRQYIGRIPSLPAVTVLFQRVGDIVTGVGDGSMDLGIAGLDMLSEEAADQSTVILHDALGYGKCSLALAVPEEWSQVRSVADLAQQARQMATQGQVLRVATKFTRLVAQFFEDQQITPYRLIAAEGALEVAPAIGYADMIADLVSSGDTLRDNRLRPVEGGVILRSQACLIANRNALKQRPEVLAAARELLEYIEAHLRAQGCSLLVANMRGDSAESVAQRLFAHPDLTGLQGPTIAPVITRDGSPNWFAIQIVVRKDAITQTIAAVRAAGGSGVVVSPVTYIFEEEPVRYRALLDTLKD